MKSLQQITLILSFILIPSIKLNATEYNLDTENLCHGFPRARIGSPKGTCVGVVATAESGLKRPRRILEIAPDFFLVTDMGGWAKNIGSLWSVDLRGDGVAHTKKVMSKLDHLHGLAMDSKGYVYLGERARILRFHKDDREMKLQVVIDDLPSEGKHPLSHFVFDEQDRLIVNVGAPTDQCLTESGKPQYPCPETEKENPEAALYRYTLDSNGKVLERELLARGLRNSMGLAIHPVSGVILQAENSMDFKEEGTPHEEINIIKKGSHYGWPYCYEYGELNPAYKKTLFNRLPKIDCSRYEAPTLLLGAHSAPLDMIFYKGDLFPEFTGKLLISYHGYRSAGHRMSYIDMSEGGKALSKEENFLYDWDLAEGVRPQGSPVGMTEAHDGKIWFVEDKNKTVMFLAPTDVIIDHTNPDPIEVTRLRPLTEENKQLLSTVRDNLFIPQCSSCHDFLGEMDSEKLHQDLFKRGLINKVDVLKSEIMTRMSGESEGMQMPPGEIVSSELINDLKKYLESLEFNLF